MTIRSSLGNLARIRLMALLVLAALASPPACPAEPEDELKAAVVLSFLRYSHWPAAETALTVGVIGRPALLQTLRRALEGKAVDNRSIKVIEVAAGWDPRCCQVLYVSPERTADIAPAFAGANRVLTIGESNRFLDLGGAVNLMLVDGRITFEVNLDALERAGITISSKLLRFGQTRAKGKGPA